MVNGAGAVVIDRAFFDAGNTASREKMRPRIEAGRVFRSDLIAPRARRVGTNTNKTLTLAEAKLSKPRSACRHSGPSRAAAGSSHQRMNVLQAPGNTWPRRN